MQEELKEAFRLYDREGELSGSLNKGNRKIGTKFGKN
jgi:hypothetical protein